MKKHIQRLTTTLLLYLLLVGGFHSCIGIDYVDLPIIGEEIRIIPLPVPLIPDQVYPVDATYFDKYGIEKEVTFEWLSSNPTVASISNTGIITPITPGKSNITVSFQGFSKAVGEVIVVDNKRIEISGAIELPFYPNQKRQLTATYFDAFGILQDVPLTWSSSNADVASVNNAGEVTALRVGKSKIQPSYLNFKGPEVEIEVTSGEKIETSTLQVALFPGQSRQLTSTYFNSGGIKTEVPLVWTSNQPTIATVSNTGLVRAISTGQATIQSSFQNFVGPIVNVVVTADLDSVASVQLTSPRDSLFTNDRLQLTARVKNINGEELPNKSVEWFSENNEILAISSTGEVTALASGTANIYAKSNGIKSNTITMVVVPREDPNAIAAIEITAPKVSLITGESLQLGVIVKNKAGQTLNGKTIEWISGNSGVVFVNSDGVITGAGNGTTSIFARSEGITSNTLTISVSTPSVIRTGTFVATGGYIAAGTATLSTQDGELILDLGADFRTSFAFGTFIYLSNSINASTVRASGVEVSEIITNGTKKFNISKLRPSIQITDYRYVVILCKPANLTFGYAELK